MPPTISVAALVFGIVLLLAASLLASLGYHRSVSSSLESQKAVSGNVEVLT